MKRPSQIPARLQLTAEKIEEATYEGSPEHKSQAWWGGLPEAYVGPDGVAKRHGKQKTTICPLVAEDDRNLATQWVREALTRGQVKYVESDRDYPRYIWYRESTGAFWSGYCINSVLGQYKGWPIEEDEKVAVFGKVG